MSTSDRFKFIKEMELSSSLQNQNQKENRFEDSAFGKLVYCHFSNVKEQTQNDVEKPFADQKDLAIIKKRDQRCYFKDSSLRIYSRGGSEFIVPMHFQVQDVYPIENGVIVKVNYDKDLLLFDPFQIRKDHQKQKPREYSYLTITDHPLDDIHPLSFGGKVDMIQTQLDILYVSYKIPFVVLYNPQTQQVIFGLLKRREENILNNVPIVSDNIMVDGEKEFTQSPAAEAYIKSIERESRHPEIYNVSKDYKLYFQEIYSFTTNSLPSKVFLSNGLTNTYEVVITMFYQEQKKVEFMSLDIRQPKIVRKTNELQNIQDIEQFHFSRQKFTSNDRVKMISKTNANNISQPDARQQICADIKIMKQRIKYLNKDSIICDTQGRNLQILQGSCLVFTFDFFSFLEGSQLTGDKLINVKTAKIEGFENSSKSNLTILFNNGSSKRFSFRLFISDYLIKSIMKTFKGILPQQIYETLNQDLIETLARSNLEQSKSSSDPQPDQFKNFQSLLLALLTGDHSSFISQTPQQKQQVQQQQQTQQQTSLAQSRPSQTLQTKILRSSTTSFGADSIATRRKTINQPAGMAQQATAVGSQQTRQQQQQQQMRTSTVSTQMMQSQQQMRKLASSGSGVESQPLSVSSTSSIAQNQVSSNPFADLLNSDFHKDNFKSKFASLFPVDMKLVSPTQLQVIQEQQPVQISPTKASAKTQAQRVSSTRQSNVIAQAQQERKNSSINQQQTQAAQPSNLVQISLLFRTQRQDLLPYFQSIFQVLHLLYQDIKLNKLIDTFESPKLAKLLLKLAINMDAQKKAAFIDYYLKEHPFLKEDLDQDLKRAFKDGHIMRDGVEIEAVPKILKTLENCLKKQQHKILNYPYPLFFERSRKIIRIFEILKQGSGNSQICPLIFNNAINKVVDISTVENLIFNRGSYLPYLNDQKQLSYSLTSVQNSSLHLFERVLFTLREESLNLEELKKLPSIVALPILEIIRYARLFQQEIQTLPQWPDSLYKLIQREDILNNLRLFQRSGKENQKANGQNSNQQNVQPATSDLAFTKQQSRKYALGRQITNVFQGTNFEDLQQEEHRKEMEQNIMKTAADLINIKGNLTGSGEDGQGSGNSKILDFLKNRFSSDTRFKEVMSMLNSSTEIIIKLENIANRESLAEEALNTEKQKLLDKMFLRHLSKSVGRGAVTFGTVQNLPTETLHIPKINQTGYVPMNETYMQIEFKDEQSKDILQWPEFHNGVAAALRIAQSFNRGKGDIHQQSHTRNWIMYHKPSEPKYEHGGFLLAIGLLGQFDTLQPTDIYQHLKSTHDATTIGILLGRAASKIGTMDDHDTRTLCIHIPYLLPPTLSIDISLSIQSAAVIGAGLLYKGTSNRLMTEMLLAQIGRKPLSDKAIEREGYALASGIALGLVNLAIGNKMQGLTDLKLDERLIRYVEGGKIMDLPQSMLSQNFNHDNTKCSSIKEGDMVNVHITSQGALIALALIHLKSNNKSIANSLVMPQSFFSLESVRPSFLLQKVLCKSLILWDEIQCSQQWIQNQIPQIIRDIYENDIQTVEKMFQQKLIEDGIDYSTAALCYVNIIAGAIFSIGFKYAGTGNKEAFKLVNDYTQFFKKLRIMQSNKDSVGMVHNNMTKNQVDKNTVETCLCVSAFAMSMIMAGTGDIDCFKALRVLRKRFEHDMHYGYNMAIHMSLGFLFLGSGAFTFSRNDLAIAALLCSLYPVFPSTPGDNRYHLQALRHFYVLAIESRLLQARDIDSGEFLNIEMKVEVIADDLDIQLKSGAKPESKILNIQTPDIINGKIRSIEVKNEKYHSVNMTFKQDEDQMKMEIDDQKETNLQTQWIDKKQKIFDQFNFQKIVYVKKRVASQVVEDKNSQKQPASQGSQNRTFISQRLEDNLQRLDLNSRDLIEEASQIFSKIQLIKDPSIEQFYKSFTNLTNFSNGSEQLSDIEDVLLAQNRDSFSQLSLIDFFKIQDLFDQIKDFMIDSKIPENVRQKLQILKVLHDSYYKDQLELIIAQLDFNFESKNSDYKSYQKSKIMTSYELFKQDQKDLYHADSLLTIALNNTQQSYPMDKQLQLLVRVLNNFSSVDFSDRLLYAFDLHELQIAKIVIEKLLNDVREKGESEIVKKYKFQKVNGLLIENGVEFEVNEMLKMSIQQLLGGDEDPELINHVIINGLMQIENQ